MPGNTDERFGKRLDCVQHFGCPLDRRLEEGYRLLNQSYGGDGSPVPPENPKFNKGGRPLSDEEIYQRLNR